jgi:hypothetical protein
MALESRLRGEVERMRTNELQRNASLQSLRVGLWKLVRVGDGRDWKMTYEGPCLEPRTGERLSALIVYECVSCEDVESGADFGSTLMVVHVVSCRIRRGSADARCS